MNGILVLFNFSLDFFSRVKIINNWFDTPLSLLVYLFRGEFIEYLLFIVIIIFVFVEIHWIALIPICLDEWRGEDDVIIPNSDSNWFQTNERTNDVIVIQSYWRRQRNSFNSAECWSGREIS